MNPTTTADAVAVINFVRPRAHYLGPPNDETFYGHPLKSRGLEHYGAFEIEQSSWVRSLERMNSVHPLHRPGMFANLRHLLFAFHDNTFECIVEGFEVFLLPGPLKAVVAEIEGRLFPE